MPLWVQGYPLLNLRVDVLFVSSVVCRHSVNLIGFPSLPFTAVVSGRNSQF